MKLTYDPRYNIAYIKFHEKTSEVETMQISDELNIDIAPDGTIYGIELLNANAQLLELDDGKVILVNEAKGSQQEIPLN